MNALSKLQFPIEIDQTQAPLGQGIEGAWPTTACWDEPTQPQDEDAFEGFVDGAGI
jgi:hypothetical protein